MLAHNYQRAVATRQRPAETWLVMCLSHSSGLAGPLVGAVLTTSAAIEGPPPRQARRGGARPAAARSCRQHAARAREGTARLRRASGPPEAHGNPPQYPLLWNGNFPRALSHALRAADLHDGIAGDFLVTRSLLLGDLLHDAARGSALIRTGLGGKALARLRRVSEVCDREVLPGLRAVPKRDTRSLGRDLA